jgi:hypothetical protein
LPNEQQFLEEAPVKSRIWWAVVTVLAVAAVAASSALAGRAVAFAGTYTGKATTKVTGRTVAITALGAGRANVVGASKISGLGKGTTTQDNPCVPFTGPGSITGSTGKITFVVLPTSRGCAAQDDQNKVTVTGSMRVTGGTGKFAKARGTLKFSGPYNRGTGVFTVRLTGALTL